MNYNGMPVAIDTVHAKTVLSQVFADRFASQGIDVNVFHPGWVKSAMARHKSFPMSARFKVGNVFMSNTSKTGIYRATLERRERHHGPVLRPQKEPRPLSFEHEYKNRLWNATEAMIERALTSPTTPN